MKKIFRYSLGLLQGILLSIALLWCVGLWCYQPISVVVAVAVACAWGGLYLYRRRYPAHTVCWLWGLVAASIATYCALPGPCPTRWQRPWAKAPTFELDPTGTKLTVHNLRDFRYRSVQDYDSAYRTEVYDLELLTGVDFAECHWDGMEIICHTMLSFHFADGRRLVISPETRLPEGVEQNAIGGLYKRYGLLYIFGTEEDIFALRTNYRHEDLYLMPLKATPQQARTMLLRVVELQQQAALHHTPYNTVTHNCSTGIVDTFGLLAPHMPYRYHLLPIHNGSISRILFEHGAFISRPGETYEDFRRRSYLGYDIATGAPEAYSEALRAKINQQR